MSKGINAPPHASPKGGSSYTSAGLPMGYDEKAVLREALENAKKDKTAVFCFGGLLFYTRNHSNTKLLCHAVRSTNHMYIRSLSSWYNKTKRMRRVPFLTYEHSTDLGNGTVVFTFSIEDTYFSMRQLMERSDHSKYGEPLFRKLVDFLVLFKDELNEGYMPLRSIHLDTVFLDERGHLYLLPLMCHPTQYPSSYPQDADNIDADERTDLYTAALLALQVSSGCEYECAAENKRMAPELVPEVVMSCLFPFSSGRYDLRSVVNILNPSKDNEEKSQEKTVNRRNPQGDVIRSNRWGRQNREQPEEAYEDKPADRGSVATTLAGIAKSIFSINPFHFIASPADQISRTADHPAAKNPPRFYENAPVSNPWSSAEARGEDSSYNDYDCYADSEDPGYHYGTEADTGCSTPPNASGGYYDGHDEPSFGNDQ